MLAGQRVGVKEVDDGIWIVSFMHYDLGYIDLEHKTLQPLDNRPKVVTYVLGTARHPCVRNGPLAFGAPGRIRTHDPWFVGRDHPCYAIDRRPLAGDTLPTGTGIPVFIVSALNE